MAIHLLIYKDHTVEEGALVKAWSLDKGLEEHRTGMKESELYEVINSDELFKWVTEVL